jgi:diglucosylglycerate octanoyltransferase
VSRLLVIADSLAFHGPRAAELLTDPRLYPNVAARLLGADVDVVARLGWTARDAWWALTKDPYVYSVLLPRADAVVLGVGGSDSLPASLPGYLRDGIAYLRPRRLRHAARRAYHRAHPLVVRATGGRRRVLPQRVTDAYLSRCVAGIRHFRPGVPIVGLVPPPYDSAYHAHVTRLHAPAAAAARAWGAREDVPMVAADAIAAPHLAVGALNPDGMHWSWPVHAEVGAAVADAVRAAGWPYAVTGNRAGAGSVSPS